MKLRSFISTCSLALLLTIPIASYANDYNHGWSQHQVNAPLWPWQSQSALEKRLIKLVQKHYDLALKDLPRGGVVVKWYQGGNSPRSGAIVIGAKRLGLPWWRSLGMSDGAISSSRIDNLRFEIGSVTKPIATSLMWLADLENQPGYNGGPAFDAQAPARQYLFNDLAWPKHSDSQQQVTEITPLHMATHSAFGENLGLLDVNRPRLFFPVRMGEKALQHAAISTPFSLLAGDTVLTQIALQVGSYRYNEKDARDFLQGTDDPNAKLFDVLKPGSSGITELTVKPGTQFSYDQLGLGLLGPMMAEHYAGEHHLYEQVLADKLFQPLGMDNTSFTSQWYDSNRTKGYNTLLKANAVWSPNPKQLKQQQGEFWTLAAGGSLDSTPGDLYRFMQAALGNVEQLGYQTDCSLYTTPNAPEICNLISAIQTGFDEQLHHQLLPGLKQLENKPFTEGGADTPGHQQLSAWASIPMPGSKADNGYRIVGKGGVAMGHLSLIKFSPQADAGVVIQQNVFSTTGLGTLGNKIMQELAKSYD